MSNPKNSKNEREEKRKQIKKKEQKQQLRTEERTNMCKEREREGGRGGGGEGVKERGAKRLVFHRITVVTLLRNAFFFSFYLSLWV